MLQILAAALPTIDHRIRDMPGPLLGQRALTDEKRMPRFHLEQEFRPSIGQGLKELLRAAKPCIIPCLGVYSLLEPSNGAEVDLWDWE